MDLEEARRKKLEELKKKIEEKRRVELLKKAILDKVLTPNARERLARVKLVKPELAEYVENLIISWYQSGKINVVDEKTLKLLLEKLYEKTRRETRIIIKRK